LRHNPLIDPRELEELHDQCFSWALTCTGGHRGDAEDVVQMTYLALIEGRARFQGGSSLKTWLFAVIRNQAYSRLRRARFALRSFIHAEESEDDVLHIYERTQESVRVLAAWRELPPRQREVLDLVFYRDLAIAEAAQILGISLGSARTHYERGKARLRRRLEGGS
jgi:RNA polymerase sigma factor (sigma-70 family)